MYPTARSSVICEGEQDLRAQAALVQLRRLVGRRSFKGDPGQELYREMELGNERPRYPARCGRMPIEQWDEVDTRSDSRSVW